MMRARLSSTTPSSAGQRAPVVDGWIRFLPAARWKWTRCSRTLCMAPSAPACSCPASGSFESCCAALIRADTAAGARVAARKPVGVMAPFAGRVILNVEERNQQIP